VPKRHLNLLRPFFASSLAPAFATCNNDADASLADSDTGGNPHERVVAISDLAAAGGPESGVLSNRSSLVTQDSPIPHPNSPAHRQFNREAPPGAYSNAQENPLP
jgi:hypothetical protein